MLPRALGCVWGAFALGSEGWLEIEASIVLTSGEGVGVFGATWSSFNKAGSFLSFFFPFFGLLFFFLQFCHFC